MRRVDGKKFRKRHNPEKDSKNLYSFQTDNTPPVSNLNSKPQSW